MCGNSRRLNMMALVVLAVTVTLPHARAASADPVRWMPADKLESRFLEVANQMEFFAIGDFLYDRKPMGLGQDATDAYLQTVRSAIPSAHAERFDRYRDPPVESVMPLLEHGDPKVRTLALAALFQREDPHLLPAIAALIDDDAETFGSPVLLANPPLHGLPPIEQKTVGQIAQSMLRIYQVHRDPHDRWRTRSGGLEQQFAAYWSERADRKHCIGWWDVRVTRATGGSRSLRDPARQRVHFVFEQINGLPPVERELTMLAVLSPDYDRIIFDQTTELIDAARRLGPERLLALIRGDPVIDDPDLPLFRGRIERFVLEHPVLFHPNQTEALLEHGRRSRLSQPFVVAAHLDRPNARTHLVEGFEVADRSDPFDRHRVRIAAALLELCGLTEEEALLEWFYDQRLRPGAIPTPRALLIERLTERFSADDRRFLEKVVMDTRFDTIDWMTLARLLRALNNKCLEPVVDPDDLRRLRHPVGESRFHHFVESGSTEHQEETRMVKQTLAEWRQRVRESVDCWRADR